MGSSVEALEGKEWKHRITGVDGNTMLFGVNILMTQDVETAGNQRKER